MTRVVFRTTSLSYFTTCGAGASLVLHGNRGKDMLVNMDFTIVWAIIGALIGGAILIGARYFSLYHAATKNKLKRGEEPAPWDTKATVAAVADVILGAGAAYLIYRVIDWLYVGEPFDADLFVFMMIGIGAISAFLVDAWFAQPWLNGELDRMYSKKAEEAQALLKSEEARKAMLDKLAEKAKVLGVVDPAKVNAFCSIAKGGDPDNLVYLQSVAQMVQNTDVKALEVFYAADEDK